MKPKKITQTFAIFFTLTAMAMVSTSVQAAGGGATEEEDINMKLREALRNVTIQLRDAQNNAAVLQAGKDEAETKVKDLTTKLEKLTKESISERNTSTNTISDLTQKLTDSEAKGANLEILVANWKKAFSDAAELAQRKEGERARLDIKRIELERSNEEQITKNIEMYKVAMELLTRYRKYSLGDAIVAREPFFGVSKVQLENIMQDYHNRLRDQRIIGGPTKETAESKSGR